MNKIKYHLHLGATSECTNIKTEATNGIGHRDMKGDTNDCFLFVSWFSLNKLVEYTMDVGTDMVGMVKTNTKVLFKDNIENIKKDWPGGS